MLSGPWRDLTLLQAPCFTCAVPVDGLGAWHFLLTQMSTQRLFPSTLAQLLPSWSGFLPLCCRHTANISGELCSVVPQAQLGEVGADGSKASVVKQHISKYGSEHGVCV